MKFNKIHEDINTHITETVTKTATGTESVTESDKHLVETKTEMHPLDESIITAIQFNSAAMSEHGNDAMWPDDDEWQRWDCVDRDSRDNGDEPCYASDADIAKQDDYAGLMRWLHEGDECSDWHPYFNNPNASDCNPDAK